MKKILYKQREVLFVLKKKINLVFQSAILQPFIHHNNNTQQTSVQNWLLFLNGNEQALFNLYETCYPLLMVFGKSRGFNAEICKDQLQQLFMMLWEKRSELPAVTKVESYMLTAFKHQLLREAKKQKRAVAVMQAASAETAFNLIPNEILETEESEKRIRLLRHYIQQLPKRQQQLLHLRFYEDFSYEEIERITGLTARTIYNKIHEAIKALRKLCLSHS
jgi:RNA polymerase sigma factor (sigma-70 family)